MKQFDTIVIGGGIIGMSIAFHLAIEEKQVLVIDANHKGRATDAGAGIIAGATTFSDEEEMYQLVSHSSQYYNEFLQILRNYTKEKTGHIKVNELITLHPDGDVIRFENAVGRILSRQKENGYPKNGTIVQLNSDEVKEMYPSLGDVEKALLYTKAAQIDGRLFNQALIDASTKLGVEILNAHVSELIIDDSRCSGVKVSDKIYNATNVIVAGGAWSAEFEEQLSISTGMLPQRGQIIHLSMPTEKVGHLPVIISSDDFYLLHWEPDTVVVGATRESGSGFDPRTTVDGIMSVLHAGRKMIPLLGDATIKEIRVGLRPYSVDRLPIIGFVPGYENIFIATGHGPLGLTAAPLTGKLVAEAILKGNVEAILPFSVERFLS